MKYLAIFSFLLLFTVLSCAPPPQTETSATPAAELLRSLHSLSGKGILFGHQDDLAYGIGWKYVDDESDTKRTAGDYPSLFGWEMGGLELGHPHNLDSVPFDRMRNFAIWVHENGGVNTFSWHPYSALDSSKNSWVVDTTVVRHILPGGSHHDVFKGYLDRVAAFFNSLQTTDGKKVPFIFRPWHEMDGGWFWWGSKTTAPDELQQLFRFTIEYLRKDKGLTDMLVAYSPDRNFNSEEEYLTWYPGDDMVDITGMDNYYDLRSEEGLQDAIRKLEIVVNYAGKSGKVAALTETGSDGIKDTTWYTETLYALLTSSQTTRKAVYAMVWRNRDLDHFYVPHPEHPAASDFRAFTGKEEILLLDEWRKAGR
jgi:mannan endo-1,4-beta-mannosidase